MNRPGKDSITLRVVPSEVKKILIRRQAELKIACGCPVSLENTVLKIVRQWHELMTAGKKN